jgi:hypothetical protein
MEYQSIIRDLTNNSQYYLEWFDSATDTQKSMIWESVWDEAARNHSENDFIQGLYDFYQVRGYLTHKQWCYLIRTIQPAILKGCSLKDRFKQKTAKDFFGGD